MLINFLMPFFIFISMGMQDREVKAVVTAYCPCKICCGPNAKGITSTGKNAYSKGCAVDPTLIPYGSVVDIPGVGKLVADDTGGAMRKDGKKGVYHIDVRFLTHEEAKKFGRKKLNIRISNNEHN